MAEFFKMPKLGMDMSEGTIVKWLKIEGEPVQKGEPLAEIETDKSSVEVESLHSGILLKRYHEEGACLPCGTPLAAIGAVGEEAPTLSLAADKPTEAPEAPAAREAGTALGAPPAGMPEGGKIPASPRARRLAEKEGVPLADLTGTGPKGRIIEQDVRALLGRRETAPARGRRSTHIENIAPLSGIRKITAQRMCQSVSEMAQTTHRVDVDMVNLIDFRRQMNEYLEPEGLKISFVDLLVAVCARALIEHLEANASLRPDGLHTFNYANVGVAVDTPRGLMVPVIRDADSLSVREIALTGRELIDKARRGSLRPEEMSGGTFTVSNLGMYELDSFTAIVNPPETCILAVGRIMDRVVALDGQLAARPMMNLGLTYDHRVLDGAPAARFLQTIKGYIEHPARLLL